MTETTPTARELIERFPLPGLILRGDDSIGFANERARARIAPGFLTANAARLCALAVHEQTLSLDLPDPSGQFHPATAYATRLAGQTVVVFDYRAGAGERHVVELQRRVFELERLSTTDRLTGLWNRRHFDEVVPREIAFSENERSPVTLLLFDLDHFKAVNDRHGHAAGDAVLRTSAARLREASRPTDLLFRWGGEEFAILAPATSATGAAAVAERVRQRVGREPFGAAGAVTVSVGVAERDAGETAKAWFARVDAALYASKSAGRNRVTIAPGGASAQWRALDDSTALRLVWNERCVSGDTLIDAEHHALFSVANTLIAELSDADLAPTALLARIDPVLASIREHFKDEEKVLAEVGYPLLAQHRDLHRKLLETAGQLRADVGAGKASAGEILEFIAYEVVNRHVLKADRLFFPFLKRRG